MTSGRSVHRESNIVRYIDRSRFNFGGKAIPLLERLHLQRIHRVDHALQLIAQLGLVAQVEIAGQHQVNGTIEIGLGGLQFARVVIRHTALISHFDCVDHRLNLRAGWGGRGCCQCFCWDCRRGGLEGRSRSLGRFCRTLGYTVLRHTSGKQQRGRGKRQQEHSGSDIQPSTIQSLR
jgi:hypothetical protein